MTIAFQNDYWDIGRIRLHVLAYPDKGPATLFLHANGMSAGTYGPFLDHLAGQLHLVAADLPGHGLSGPPATNPIRSWHTFVPDLYQLILRHFKPPIYVVGHSLGAATAFFAAARYPEMISRLVMIDPVIFPRPMIWGISLITALGLAGQIPLVKTARRRKYLFNSRQEASQRFMSGKGMFKTWDKPFIQAYIDSAIDFAQAPARLRCHPETEAQIFASTPSDAWEYAPMLQCPVLLLRGQHSDAFFPYSARQLLKKIPNCRLENIDDTTHFLPMERPDLVAAAVLDHLSE